MTLAAHRQLVAAATDLYCLGRDRELSLERASRWLHRVLRSEPADPQALRLLGLVELDRGALAPAAAAYRALLRLDRPEQRLEGHLGLARCQLARGRPGRAIALLDRVPSRDLTARPATVECLHRLYACKVEALRRCHQPKRAVALLQRAVRRFERAGLDAEPLELELLLCRAGASELERLPQLSWQAPRSVVTSRPPPGYSLRRSACRRILSACRGRHEERCGYLFGRGRRLERLRLLRNVDELPELACSTVPEQRRSVWQQERQRGLVLLAEFHSHTAGPAVPSRADCAAWGRLLIIYADAFDELRAWRVKRTYRATLKAERRLTLVS
ncbi:MAG: Mov34/MPN/PAD-1 family protein [Deltaproteobacteria bacterium]|nr:Mov34/MPN/PAD-1 family protein [Deltaproteobacteria bacterium]MBW2534823.1 Mov34/MPN/PAD-1 family protein [Deltaproteobacteria bacterium]